MFELSVARKYLIPRRRQLSVSIISLISVVVISLVVWLIVLFFSVTDGLERNWVEKLVALTAPVRITPTEAYYHSYYYQIDSISADSDYAYRSIGEKLAAERSDPYDPQVDIEVPTRWSPADRLEGGALRDPVKEAFAAVDAIQGIPGLSASEYEMTFGQLKLRILRGYGSEHSGVYHEYQSSMSQSAYLGSFDGRNPRLARALQKPTMTDFSNLLHQVTFSSQQALQSDPEGLDNASAAEVQGRLRRYFDHITVTGLETREEGWLLPAQCIPTSGDWAACALLDAGRVLRVVIAADAAQLSTLTQRLSNSNPLWVAGQLRLGTERNFSIAGRQSLPLHPRTPILLEGGLSLQAELQTASLDTAKSDDELLFRIHTTVQGRPIEGVVSYGGLRIRNASLKEGPGAGWAYRQDKGAQIPAGTVEGEPILLARGYREHGVCIGDRGYLSYYAPTATSVQEQRLPVYVAGFYDPGIMPMGSKFVFSNPELIAQMRSSFAEDEGTAANGINVWMDDLNDADRVQAQLKEAFRKAGISQYWKIETYKEFDFTRDLINQLQSERNVFTLIAVIIIVVACSNIISMLIILVNDKRVEIGILRSMGASARSIGGIFGTCGVTMGLLGGLIGTGAAVATLHYLQELVNFISAVQGYDAFNKMFYGDSLPNELSYRALSFVFVATLLISLLAGIIPAIKAARMRPAAILRSE